MTARDAILHAHGCDVTGFYRGDAVVLPDGREGLVLVSDPRGDTVVLCSPREICTLPTAQVSSAALAGV